MPPIGALAVPAALPADGPCALQVGGQEAEGPLQEVLRRVAASMGVLRPLATAPSQEAGATAVAEGIP